MKPRLQLKSKKMKKGFSTYIFVASLALFCSCSKFLDKEPLSSATDENFWKDQTEADGAVAGGYALLRQSLSDGYAYYAYGDLPTDEFRADLGGEDLAQITSMQ